MQARRCPTGGGQAKPPRCRWQPAGELSSRPPQARSKATGGGIARWGQSPALSGGTQDHPVYTVAAERGCGVDCKASKATSRNRVVLRRRRMTGPSRAARRPQADPAREAPTGAECKPVGRAGQAQPDRSDFESDFGESAAIAAIYRSHFPVSASKPPRNRGQVLSTKTPRSWRFLALKRPPFRGYKHHGMQQI